MWISKKKWEELEKRVTDLEKVQSQPDKKEITPLEKMKAALKETLCQVQKPIQIGIKVP